MYLANNVIKKGINILRVNDPDFIHLFHPKHCDSRLSKQQLDGCLKDFFQLEGELSATIRYCQHLYGMFVKMKVR